MTSPSWLLVSELDGSSEVPTSEVVGFSLEEGSGVGVSVPQEARIMAALSGKNAQMSFLLFISFPF